MLVLKQQFFSDLSIEKPGSILLSYCSGRRMCIIQVRGKDCMKKVIGLFFLSFFPLVADEKTEKVDEIFKEWSTAATPGVSLAIVKEGEIIYERGYGMAKIEDDIVMTPQKVFNVASNAKQFTAACLAILIQQGKVRLDDDIRMYFPEMPQYERPILVKHLVYHTSGLRDYIALFLLAGFQPDSFCPTDGEVFNIIFKQKKLNFLPGEWFSYTNTGYFLIAKIVEKVSGTSLNSFAQENIFKPLGCASTFFRHNHTQIIKNLATAYRAAKKGGYEIWVHNWDQVGDGGLFTTARDLYLWDQAFYNHLLGKDLMCLIQEKGRRNNGAQFNYAFGLRMGEYRGLKTVFHGGLWAGYATQCVRFPEQKFSVICLTNLETQDPLSLCYKVADIYLSDCMKKRRETKVSLSEQEIKEVIGKYWDQGLGMWFFISKQQDMLVFSAMGTEGALSQISETVFEVCDLPVELSLEFLKDSEKEVKGAVLREGDGTEHDLIKASVVDMTPEQLEEYVGEYESEETLNVPNWVFINNGQLVLKNRKASFDLFVAIAKDTFAQDEFIVEFVRTEGKISGFKLTGWDRVAEIEYVKSGNKK